MKYLLVLTTALCLFTIRTTHAQEQKKRQRQRSDAAFFDRLDTNNDGIVTMDEVPAERLDAAERIFDRLDGDKDGKLTRAEFDAGMSRARPRAKKERQQRKRPETASQATQPEKPRKPDEPQRPDQGPRPDQPPFGDRPGPGPFGFGGPDLFRALDSDKDGRLSKPELANAVDALMKYDRNSDRLLTPDELAKGMRGSPGPGGPRPPGFPPGEAPGRVLEGMMQRMDKNGDGKVTKDEVPDMLRERFEEIDKNKDGLLDWDELGAVGDRLRRRREQGGAPPGFPGRPGTPPGAPPGGLTDANRERVAGSLREHDKDIDGRISAKEFGDDRADEFKKLDSNGDGYLSPDELARGIR